MPTRRLKRLIVLACVALAVLASAARAGDAPIFVFGDWGVGEIDGRIMFYTGRDSYVFTPIPAPPHGPRWDFAYNVFPFVLLGGVALLLYRRRHNQTIMNPRLRQPSIVRAADRTPRSGASPFQL
ncbi:MAG TPA: hypothetical protein VGR35_17190 [Tepidisphaeraceae bacterium]|nr:hypothetical protein [Tepidisphaeraceae bacterium]